MRILYGLAIALFTLALLSCQGSKQGNQQSGGVDMTVRGDIKLDGTATTVAGVTFTPPSAWKDLGASGMRQANYTFGPVEGESDSATMAVFYFGKGQGGDVQANIERWIGQMALPDGSDPHSAAGQTEFKADGMVVHWLLISGTYASGGMMGGAVVPKPGYKMAGAVVEGPDGNLFFKLTGPEKGSAQMIEGMKAMLMAAKKASA